MLNKKLDSLRGHGNGTTLVRNLLRNMDKQSGPLGLALDNETETSNLNLHHNPFQDKIKNIKQSEIEMSSYRSNLSPTEKIKLESRGTAFLISERNVKLLIQNKNYWPKFETPKFKVNLEYSRTPIETSNNFHLSKSKTLKEKSKYALAKGLSLGRNTYEWIPSIVKQFPKKLQARIEDVIEVNQSKIREPMEKYHN